MKQCALIVMLLVAVSGFGWAEDPAPIVVEAQTADSALAPTPDPAPQAEAAPLPTVEDFFIGMMNADEAKRILDSGFVPKYLRGKKGLQDQKLLLMAITQIVGALPKEELSDLRTQVEALAPQPKTAEEAIALKRQMLAARKDAIDAYKAELATAQQVVSFAIWLRGQHPSFFTKFMGFLGQAAGIASDGASAYSDIQFGRKYHPTEIKQQQGQISLGGGLPEDVFDLPGDCGTCK